MPYEFDQHHIYLTQPRIFILRQEINRDDVHIQKDARSRQQRLVERLAPAAHNVFA